MSHSPERKEKNCLNCGTEVVGLYCHVCGQKNIEPKESFWGLITHFFQDLTHWDGKFFSTIKYIITRPGFLTREFVNGRRVAYLHPVKLYVFTSALFFIIFFSLVSAEDSVKAGLTGPEIDQMDSAELAVVSREINDGKPLTKEELRRRVDSSGINFTGTKYRSKEHYDSLIKTEEKKHNWFTRQLVYKQIALNKKYHNNAKLVIIAIWDKFLHILPQMLFVLLPLFALGLKILYIRRKRYYYADHIIFTLHFYVFLFIAMLVMMGLAQLYEWSGWTILRMITAFIVIGIFFYLYKALRNFYQQRRAKTIFKYITLLLYTLILTMTLFILFLILSVYQM